MSEELRKTTESEALN